MKALLVALALACFGCQPASMPTYTVQQHGQHRAIAIAKREPVVQRVAYHGGDRPFTNVSVVARPVAGNEWDVTFTTPPPRGRVILVRVDVYYGTVVSVQVNEV